MTKIYLAMRETLGDVILMSTICRNLKLKYPESQITVVAGLPFAEALKGNPDIYRLFPTRPDQKNDVYIKSCADKYDLVFLPFQKTHQDTMWHHQPDANYHLVDFYAKRCGDLELKDRRTFIYPDDKNKENVAKLWGEFPQVNQKPCVAMHCQSPVSSKSWGVENFTKLALALESKGFCVIQVGAGNDQKIQTPHIVDLRGRTSPRETALAITKAILYVGIDSGPSYLADAMGVPSIILYGATTHIQAGPLSPLSIPLEPERQQEWPCGPGYLTCSTHCLLGASRECIKNHDRDQVIPFVFSILKKRMDQLMAMVKEKQEAKV